MPRFALFYALLGFLSFIYNTYRIISLSKNWEYSTQNVLFSIVATILQMPESTVSYVKPHPANKYFLFSPVT